MTGSDIAIKMFGIDEYDDMMEFLSNDLKSTEVYNITFSDKIWVIVYKAE